MNKKDGGGTPAQPVGGLARPRRGAADRTAADGRVPTEHEHDHHPARRYGGCGRGPSPSPAVPAVTAAAPRVEPDAACVLRQRTTGGRQRP